ncbi:MAG: aminoacetone oxidase family FAD-binding enzyme [Oscillospiraceae bacterium]|nr:aminoacetone oxidase family FAD-binding enzyme [Oscillospiraceae bacterium]
MAEVVIIGGGASGMAAAIAAAESGEHNVTLIERQARVGRKLLSTGNGRCNITNIGASAENYHGGDRRFAEYALGLWTPERVLGFFSELGLMTVTEYGGRVYPLSNQASSVLDVLRFALEKPNIRLLTGVTVESVRRRGSGFELRWEGESLRCDKLVVACGGCAGSKLGGVMDGYNLLKSLGHSRTSLYPSLTQIRTRPEIPRSMKGVKVQAAVKALKGKRELDRSSGDLLFADNGVSGTVVFDISRAVATAGEGVSLEIDLFENLDRSGVKKYLYSRREARPAAPAKEIFAGALHSRVGMALCKYAGINPENPCSELSAANMDALASAAKALRLEVTGVSGFESAQVTAGGISTAEFDPKTMESRIVPGVYACGEVLDIDGDCGGYNLQWAWASGLLAGESL